MKLQKEYNKDRMVRYSLLLTEEQHHNLKKKAYAELMTIADFIKKELCN